MRHTLRENLRRYFFSGLLVFLPLAITLWFLGWVIGVMDGLLNVLPGWMQPKAYLPFAVPGLGALFTLALILFLGFLTTGVATRRLLAVWDKILGRIPVFRGIYTAVQKLVETFLGQANGNRQVVMIQYPRTGIYTIGFAMGKAWRGLEKQSEDRLMNIFVPTTPNPTSGFYLLVPEKDITPLDITMEEALKLIASGGLITPEGKTRVHP